MDKPKRQHGGFRPGSGRKPGTKNAKTVERERMIAAAEAAARASLTSDQIAALGPLEVMALAMRHHFAAGNMSVAADIAAKLAPYVAPRLASSTDTVTAEDARAAAVLGIASDPDPGTDATRGTKGDGMVVKLAVVRDSAA